LFIDRISKGKLTLIVIFVILGVSAISFNKYKTFTESDYMELNNNLQSLSDEQNNIDSKIASLNAEISKKEKHIDEIKKRMKKINLKLSNELFSSYINDFNANKLVNLEIIDSKQNADCNNVADYTIKYTILDKDFSKSALSMAVNFVSIFSELVDVDQNQNILIIKHKI
jgi:hypothetical protein